ACLAGNPATSAPETATIFPIPVLAVIADDTVCYNTPASLTANVSGGTGTISYLWSNSATTATINPLITQNTQLWVQVSDIHSCQASDTLLVLVSNPVVNLGANDTACKGDIIPLASQASGGFTPYTYAWTTGGSMAQINLTAVSDTCATVTLTDKAGCTAKDTVCILVSHITANAGADQGACTGNQATFSGSASNGFPPYSYTWNNNPGQSYQFVANANTTMVFKVTDTFGCSATDTALLTAWQNPVLAPIADDTICYNTPASLTANVTGGTGTVSYLWSNSATTATINPLITQDAQFWVVATDFHNCQASDTLLVIVSNPQPDIGPDIALCYGDQAQLSGQVTGGFGPISYFWSNGSTAQQISHTGLTDTCIWLMVTDQIGCEAKDTACIQVHPLPLPNLGPDDTICISHVITLDPGTGFSSYLWSTGSSTPSITLIGSTLGAGTFQYSVMVTNQFACSNADTIHITVDPCIDIREISHDQLIELYPNPASDYIMIRMRNTGVQSIVITNMSGKTVYSKDILPENADSFGIDTSSLPPGIYMVCFITPEFTIARKLLLY
ncbi:MAG: T9SS type A sorting domain-containing protein, partial [Bacteroidales bacterium]